MINFDPATGKINDAGTTFNINATGTVSTFNVIEVDWSALTLFEGNTTVEATTGDVDGLGSGNQAGSISGFEVGLMDWLLVDTPMVRLRNLVKSLLPNSKTQRVFKKK